MARRRRPAAILALLLWLGALGWIGSEGAAEAPVGFLAIGAALGVGGAALLLRELRGRPPTAPRIGPPAPRRDRGDGPDADRGGGDDGGGGGD